MQNHSWRLTVILLGLGAVLGYIAASIDVNNAGSGAPPKADSPKSSPENGVLVALAVVLDGVGGDERVQADQFQRRPPGFFGALACQRIGD